MREWFRRPQVAAMPSRSLERALRHAAALLGPTKPGGPAFPMARVPQPDLENLDPLLVGLDQRSRDRESEAVGREWVVLFRIRWKSDFGIFPTNIGKCRDDSSYSSIFQGLVFPDANAVDLEMGKLMSTKPPSTLSLSSFPS